MGTAEVANEPEESNGLLVHAVEAIRSSVLLVLALIGVVEVVLAYGLELAIQAGLFGRGVGVWSAIFAVWGLGLIVVGLSGYGIIWFKRR